MGRPIVVVQVVVGRFGRRIHRRASSDEWKRTTEPPGALLTAGASVPTMRSRSVDADDADDVDEDVVKSSSLMRCITRRGTG